MTVSIATGVLIFVAISTTLSGHVKKNDRVLKIGLVLLLAIIAGLFIYCQSLYAGHINPRELVSVSLFFAVMIALVLKH